MLDRLIESRPTNAEWRRALPVASAATLGHAVNPQCESVDDAVSMGIRRDGTFIIGKEVVAPRELAARLSALYERRPGDYLLYLWADADVEYPVVLDAIDAARAAGVRTVGAIVTPRAADAGK